MGIKITSDQIERPRTQGWGVVRLTKGQKFDTTRTHQHDYDEYVVILKGRCLLHNDGKDVEYVAGDIGLFPRHQQHCSAEALEDTTYLWTRGDVPVTTEAGQPAATPSTPNKTGMM